MQGGWHQIVIVSLIVALGALGLLEIVADRLLVQEPLAGMASVGEPADAWPGTPLVVQHSPVPGDERGGAAAAVTPAAREGARSH